MIYVAAHAAALALLLVLFHVTGLLIVRAIRALDGVGSRTGILPIAIGIAVWTYALMALAALQLYRRPVLIAAGALVLVAGIVRTWRTPQRRRWSALHALAWVPLAIVLAQLFVRTLGPWLGWDDMTAHLTLPKIYLEHGGFRRVPFNVYSNWPLNIPLLFGFALAVQDYVLAKLVHLMFLGLLTVGVYRFAVGAGAPWAGAVAAALLLANDVVLVEAPVANVDIGVAFFFFMAVALAVEFRETGRRAALVLSGVFCGCVAGSKVTGLGAVACVFPLVAIGSVAHGSTRPRALLRDAAIFAAAALALALPWMIKSYVYTGDPLYPVLWRYFGGVEWSAALNDRFWLWQNSIGMGRTLRDYALLPVRVILQGGGGYQNFAAWISKTWIVFLPLTMLCLPFVPAARRVLLPAALYFIVWAFSSQQTRFLISVLPLLAVATAVTAAWVVDRLARLAAARRRETVRVALATIVVIGSLGVLGWATRYVRSGSLEAARNLFVDPPNLREWTPHPVYTFVRQQLPPSAKLMLLDINHGFFLDREYIADSFFEASQLNELISAAHDRADLTRLFERLGVTHVLVDRAPWVKFPPLLWDYLGDPASAALLYRSPDGQFTVYQLAPRTARAGRRTGLREIASA